MTVLAALFRLAVLDAWISYRLVAFVAALGAVGLIVPLVAFSVPPAISGGAKAPSVIDALSWYGAALGAIGALLAASAANVMARDRVTGTAGWLLAGPVPRGAFYVSSLLAFAAIAFLGMTLSAVAAWLTLASLGAAPDGGTFAIAAAAATACLIVVVALGLAVGTVLPSGRAGLAAAGVTVVLLATGLILPGVARWLPTGGLVRLAPVTLVDGLPGGLQALGAAVAAMAVLAALGALALSRAEL